MGSFSVIVPYLLLNCHLITRTHILTDASCLNHDNNVVNWWFIYRFPKKAIHPDKHHVFDHEYLYYDDTYSDPSNVPSAEPIHTATKISKMPADKKKAVAKKPRPQKEPHKTKQSPKRKRMEHEDDDALDLEELDIDPSNIITGKRTRASRRRLSLSRLTGIVTDMLTEMDTLSSLHQQLHQHKRNPLSNTLKQFYSDKRRSAKAHEWNAFVYSDDPPGPTISDSKVHAHAKGFLAYHVASSKGYWLIHSVPNFPDLEPNKYEYDADITYGQTFFCITLRDEESILNVVEQLRAMHKLKMYFQQNIMQPIATTIDNRLAAAFDLLYKGEYTDITTACSVKDIVAQKREHWWSSSRSPKITHFAKSGHYHQDIFACLVTELKQDFKFETWMRGGQRSFCTSTKCGNTKCQYSHNLINVDRVEMDTFGVKWRSDQDHAKIGSSIAPDGYMTGFKEYVCIGDMNRMYSQRNRGGGYICIQDKHFWKVIDGILKEERVLECEIPY